METRCCEIFQELRSRQTLRRQRASLQKSKNSSSTLLRLTICKKLRLPLFFCGRRVILENQKIVSTRNLTPLFNFNFALSNSWCRRCCCLAPDFGPDNICPSDPHSLKKVADFFRLSVNLRFRANVEQQSRRVQISALFKQFDAAIKRI